MAGNVLIKILEANIGERKEHPASIILQSTVGAFVNSQVYFIKLPPTEGTRAQGAVMDQQGSHQGLSGTQCGGWFQEERGSRSSFFPFSLWLSKGESHRVGRVIAEECESLWRPRTLYEVKNILEPSLLRKTQIRNNSGILMIKSRHGPQQEIVTYGSVC